MRAFLPRHISSNPKIGDPIRHLFTFFFFFWVGGGGGGGAARVREARWRWLAN